MNRYDVIKHVLYVHTSGRKVSPYGALPWTNPSEKDQWELKQFGWTVRDNNTNTIGFGRPPFETEELANAFVADLVAKDLETAKLYEKTLIARWESRSGKHFAELLRDSMGYSYRGRDCGGSMGQMEESQAMATMQAKVDSGYFLPDSAKTPMRRVL